MNKRLQGFAAGILCCVLFVGISVFAKNTTETIQALYKDIKIYVDGVKIDPKDANGNTVEPFVYNGTTYLPVRAVGEAIGKQVTWDGATSSVYLGEKPGDTQYLSDICPPYDGYWYDVHKSSKGKFVTIGGKDYSNVVEIGGGGHALFRLDGKYKNLSFEIGRLDTRSSKDVTMNIYLDGELALTKKLNGDDLPQKVNLDLKYALQMKIELTDNVNTAYGLVNAVIK